MDYEQKYKEALERARTMLTNELAADIFPELTESEDERIRKALKEYFINSFQNNGVAAICGVHIKDILNWLEKQGEYTPIVMIPKFRVGDVIRPKGSTAEYAIESISGECYHGKGWGLHISGDNDYELVEQNNAWSEEDENRINRLIAYFEDKESFTAEDDIVYANWLKSLKERYTWRPSDEQMNMLKIAVSTSNSIVLDSLYNDLKKLREK